MRGLICNFCSYRSIATRLRNAADADSVLSNPMPSPTGLHCSYPDCSGYACSNCLPKIVRCFSKETQASDQWCVDVNRFIETGFANPQFIGNCCEWKAERARLLEESRLSRTPTKFDGFLYLPEFKLLIDSPFGCIDVHGLGRSAGKGLRGKHDELPAAWHCVISHEAAARYHSEGLRPVSSVGFIQERIFHQVSIPLPYSQHSTKKVSQFHFCMKLWPEYQLIINRFSLMFVCAPSCSRRILIGVSKEQTLLLVLS
jgi:hypothetical protein